MSKPTHPEAFARVLSATADPLNLQPEIAPAPESAGALTVQPTPAAALPMPAEAPGTALVPQDDEHGFDLADYKWVPVRRRPRKDGWTEAKQRLFIEVLADTACVEQAATAVGMTVQGAYALRRAPGGEPFAAAWSAATQQASLKLVDIAFNRAMDGSDEPVFDRDGNRIGRRMRQNDRLLMFLLRAHLPERYRHAHRDTRLPGEAPPPAIRPLAEAIARLEPAVPPDPHLLLSPEDLDVELEVADMCDGRLPHWYSPEAAEESPAVSSLGEAFERQLEAAKQANAGPGDDLDEAWDDDGFD